MRTHFHLVALGILSTAVHAATPAGIGRFLAQELARIDHCAPSARIEGACARQWSQAATTAEDAARLFTTQLIRIEHFADQHPELAHTAFGQAMDQILTVYGLRFPSQEDRKRLEDADVLMAFTAENIDRFWRTVGIMWGRDPKASDPQLWLGRMIVGAGGPRLTRACEDRLKSKLRY